MRVLYLFCENHGYSGQGHGWRVRVTQSRTIVKLQLYNGTIQTKGNKHT